MAKVKKIGKNRTKNIDPFFAFAHAVKSAHCTDQQNVGICMCIPLYVEFSIK